MGPWGDVIANNLTDCQAVTTVKYDDKPTYHAIIVARPDLEISTFPESSMGRSISFADIGSTSAWLIPSFYSKEVWKIDPKNFWKYSEGASHPANEIAVAAGQVDMATDFDGTRNAMFLAGRIKLDATKIVWASRALPNDAFAVPKSAPKEFAQQVQSILTGITVEQAKTVIPNRYTGFVNATHATFQTTEDVGVILGRVEKKS
jgi:phosphonate transport system substrate-binding protein